MTKLTVPRLETARLILRELHPDDLAAVHAIFSDAEVSRYLDNETLSSMEQAQELLDSLIGDSEAGHAVRWGIARREDEAVIGTCGFHCFSWRDHRAEVGFELIPAHWRQGIMSEALRASLQHAFSAWGLNRIEATVHLRNDASRGFLKALGFREEGILREYEFSRGRFNTVRILSLLRHEYQGNG